MHIFLTGEVQVGKTTVIAKALAQLNIRHGGFKTYFGPNRGSINKLLYMNAAQEPPVFSAENSIACFREGFMPEVFTEKFNTIGVALIRSARANSQLIIMDECGSFEGDAFEFQKEIIKTLDSKKPVFGVIKLASRGWTDHLRNHNNVRLITVTRENRDDLAKICARYLDDSFKQLWE